ncbi:MAG: hypothetical protein KGL69_04115 [Alphaproteobacteria bacterium]|nr:hypothetical protein [Alphaproteobacteria bacterium]
MEIHRPKAAETWREFLVEIGTITCGILIALGLEQALTGFDWAQKVTETRSALGLELAENLGKIEVRVELASCINQRLDALARIVDSATLSGALPALPAPRTPPYYSWGTGVWESALSSQTASHLPVEQLRGYSRLYQILDRIAAAEPQEEQAWTVLYGLAGPGRAFNADDARMYRRAIGEARQMNGLISGFGVRAKQAVAANHFTYDQNLFRQRVEPLKHTRLDCGPPTGTPPMTYGAAPAEDFAAHAIAEPRS